jgi:chorismate mutase
MPIRGIRGAITATENTAEAILSATRLLVTEIEASNLGLLPQDVASIFFTVTSDLNAAFPALAVRQLGWVLVPILCAQEIPVPDSLGSCIRVLIHWNTDKPQDQIQHVYLGAAHVLRPDFNSST